MRILITGGSGFVGSVLGPRLIAAGHELFCVCRPGSSAPFGQIVVWDATSVAEMAKLPKGIDVVIHLAQSRSYRSLTADAREMFDVNVAMTMSLLQWAAQSGVKHFCLASSGTVYEPFAGSLHEDAAVAPIGFLGASKLASEIVARPFSHLFNLNVLRLFFPFGPGQRDRLIPDLIRRVRHGEAIQVTADGEGTRLVPTFVGDVADVFLASVASSWAGTVNVATSESLSIRQIVDSIGRQLGIAPKLEIVDKPPIEIIPNLERLAGLFALNRFTRFEDGLRLTIGAKSTDDQGWHSEHL
jgi:nucleoside-diphosphate-sugar epimerase